MSSDFKYGVKVNGKMITFVAIQRVQKMAKRKRSGASAKKAFVAEFILDRLHQVVENPNITNQWKVFDLDGSYYHLRRTKFEPNNIPINKDAAKSRKAVKSYIKTICDILGIKRGDIGIVAQEWATMYFRGVLYQVDDKFSQLQHLGADVVIIEKSRIAKAMEPFADIYGIAIVNTHGFLTEYAVELSDALQLSGGNVVVLTDFDISGILIALKAKNVIRIGVDLETLEWLGFETDPTSLKSFDETYTPEKSHYSGVIQELQKLKGQVSEKYRRLLTSENIEYLKRRRIEINAIWERIGDEQLWEFIIYKLQTEFTYSNQNRVIDVKEIARGIIPPDVMKIYSIIMKRVRKVIEDDTNNYISNFTEYASNGNGSRLIVVKDEERLIKSNLHEVSANDPKLKPTLKKIGILAVALESMFTPEELKEEDENK